MSGNVSQTPWSFDPLHGEWKKATQVIESYLLSMRGASIPLPRDSKGILQGFLILPGISESGEKTDILHFDLESREMKRTGQFMSPARIDHVAFTVPLSFCG